MRKTNGIFVVFWNFENFDFFSISYQKNGIITLIIGKF